MNLFASEDGFETINLINGTILFNPNFLGAVEADELFNVIDNKVEWSQQQIRMYGKEYNIPRLTSWYGDKDAGYKYSGIMNEPLPWIPVLQDLRIKIEDVCQASFNSLLLNKYRDGNDKVAWHCDNEKEFGQNPTIASLSLGAERRFDIRNLEDKKEKYPFPLSNGSLIVMKDEFQHFWEHQIPVQKKVSGTRINLTFRKVIKQ